MVFFVSQIHVVYTSYLHLVFQNDVADQYADSAEEIDQCLMSHRG